MSDLSEEFSGTLGEIFQTIKKSLEAGGIEHPGFEARLIIERRTGLDQAVLISEPARLVSQTQRHKILDDVSQRLSGKSLHRIYGEREFWGLPFYMGPQTLEPRPDTETLISVALALFGGELPAKVLDLGTGSGCILLSLLKEWPDSEGIGVDLSFETLKVAQENAERLGVRDRARFICGSWAEALKGPFELVVSNPPYIVRSEIPGLAPEVRDHDPILALDGGEDGLEAYRQIFSMLPRLISRSGKALFEIGSEQEESVMRLAEKYGFSIRKAHRDLAGRPRVVEISCGDK
ncbi:MAG: peptide chain release factor N(5)-glutamine methyltransferase [Alphaproteobacteria bacterium]|jgi:release factor glutamine methyltransferase|nr:peptide chain release factor N(5)-glutamine methyltransferase [Alphaproteobacteria bacterium]QQS56589.1 MAG: peptide chain release factor N(5)-glutamine methyltransferase [Alphaproteobacteria bacterium]